jgi:hypothetical protein
VAQLEHAACVDALELVYMRSLGCTGYVAPTMALCIGCVRAVTFGDPAAIVWLDVNQTVWKVLLVQFITRTLTLTFVWIGAKLRLRHFVLSARLGAAHPLRNTAFRVFDRKGYAVAFGMGGAFVYGVFIAFLGPAFVTGMCRDFAPNATHVWVHWALECRGTSVVGFVRHGTNDTLTGVA